MKTIYKTIAVAFMSLAVCWFIGQQINPQNERAQQDVQKEVNDSRWNLTDYIDSTEVVITGLMNGTDYPYGCNVGKIQDEIFEQAVLITPGTEIKFQLSELKGDQLQISHQIHPWVAQNSDGALLCLRLLHDGGTREWRYEVSGQREGVVVDLSEYLGQDVEMELSVINKEGYHEECDWVIIDEFIVCKKENGIAADNNTNESKFGLEGYVKSATYFADECPINFWNSEMDNLSKDFKQISSDGFDSVIIVIPWREFQPEVSPVSYNQYAFEALENLMKTADEQGLEVYVRVGYTWDYYEDRNESVLNRYERLLSDATYMTAWLEYAEKLYEVLSTYENFGGGFFTWEDHWNILEACNIESREIRVAKAKEMGYQEWVKNNYSLTVYNEKFGTNYEEYEQIAIPDVKKADMYAMYEFCDGFHMELLSLTQERFPGLSMEVRLDWDVIYDKEGNASHYEHGNTYSCGNADFVAAMYGIPMGCVNNGERISYMEAMGKTEHILEDLSLKTGGKPVYIEQFIFADNTPEFSHNAQIIEEEVVEYLKNISDVLCVYSKGYGIWTYKNYRKNMIYNSQFALNDFGWEKGGEVTFEKKQNSMACGLKEGSSIMQYIPKKRYSFASNEYYCSFDIRETSGTAKLQIDVGGVIEIIDVFGGEEIKYSYMRDTNLNSDFYVKFKAVEGDIWIDNVRLYSHTQEGFLYDENNIELRCIEGIRELNYKLSNMN